MQGLSDFNTIVTHVDIRGSQGMILGSGQASTLCKPACWASLTLRIPLYSLSVDAGRQENLQTIRCATVWGSEPWTALDLAAGVDRFYPTLNSSV